MATKSSKGRAARPKSRRAPSPKKAGVVRHDQPLRQHIINLLRGGHAHIEFDRAVGDLPAELRGSKPAGLPYSIW